MERTKLNNLIELLEEFQTLEYWNDTDLLKNATFYEENGEIELDVNTVIDMLLDFIEKNYIMQDVNAWKIRKG